MPGLIRHPVGASCHAGLDPIGINFILEFCTALLYSTFPGGAAMKNEIAVLDDDWSVLVSFLPDGWREKAKELNAIGCSYFVSEINQSRRAVS